MDEDVEKALDDAPSKSARKREMHALQALGETLVNLTEKQLAQIPIADDDLREAITECRNIRSHSARKRHLQFIGKLMRNIDPQPIADALGSLHHQQQSNNDTFHALESLRDAMLSAGASGVELAIERYPQADRQHLRQLLRQHTKEQEQQKPPAASRKLFRYLRELEDNAVD